MYIKMTGNTKNKCNKREYYEKIKKKRKKRMF